DELQRTEEARRVAGREQLLGIGAFAAGTAQRTRRGQGEVQRAVGGGGAAFAAAGGGGGAGVEDLLEGHGGLLAGQVGGGGAGASGEASSALPRRGEADPTSGKLDRASAMACALRAQVRARLSPGTGDHGHVHPHWSSR